MEMALQRERLKKSFQKYKGTSRAEARAEREVSSASSLAPEWESGFADGRSEACSLAPRGRGLGRGGQDRARERGKELRTVPFNARRSKAGAEARTILIPSPLEGEG